MSRSDNLTKEQRPGFVKDGQVIGRVLPDTEDVISMSGSSSGDLKYVDTKNATRQIVESRWNNIPISRG